jgi:serine/threonine protein kinase
MLEEPYNFPKEFYETYSNIIEDNNHFEYNNIRDYICEKLLGTGSYASVYQVYKENDIQTKFAIKISKEDKQEENVTNNEITILRKLGHCNNIIKLYDSFYYKDKKTKNKHLCIILDNLGCDLNVLKRIFKYNGTIDIDSDSSSSNNSKNNNILKKGLPLCLSKKIGYQILNALKHMHDKNIIHTDIKLENILITNRLEDIKYNKDINIKLCDFGTSHQTNSKCNYNIGTIDYSAPECIIGLPYGKGIDIWAFGCILYELITGDCLFDYSRYYYDADECSSGYTSSTGEEENDKTQIEFLLLCMMKIILGSFPSKIFKKGKYYENYFDYKGRLRFIPKFIEEDELINLLINDFQFDKNIVCNINDFLLKCLSINPNERYNVNQLIEDNWFNDKCD